MVHASTWLIDSWVMEELEESEELEEWKKEIKNSKTSPLLLHRNSKKESLLKNCFREKFYEKKQIYEKNLNQKKWNEKNLDKKVWDENHLDEKNSNEIKWNEKILNQKILNEKHLDEKKLKENNLDEKIVNEKNLNEKNKFENEIFGKSISKFPFFSSRKSFFRENFQKTFQKFSEKNSSTIRLEKIFQKISPPTCIRNLLTDCESYTLKTNVDYNSWAFKCYRTLPAVTEKDKSCRLIDWDSLPASCDPLRGSNFKKTLKPSQEGRMERGERKRSQVENMAHVLFCLHLPRGSTLVDFGCGSGALCLPLAKIFPRHSFIGVDMKENSIRLLEKRAKEAGITNLRGWFGRIETFFEKFDACMCLHACGSATDHALSRAASWHAAYVASPCCLGKLNHVRKPNPSYPKSIPVSTSNSSELANDSLDMHSCHAIGEKPCHVSESILNEDEEDDEDDDEDNDSCHVSKETESQSLLYSPFSSSSTSSSSLIANKDKYCHVSDLGNGKIGSCEIHAIEKNVEHDLHAESANLIQKSSNHCNEIFFEENGLPKSRWLKSILTKEEFCLVVKNADWSCYDYFNEKSKFHKISKAIVELDRNEWMFELGYKTHLLHLSNYKAGAIGISDILVGTYGNDKFEYYLL